MFVRTVYVTGDPARIDAAVRALNSEGRSLLEERPGYRGAGVFVDRELGKLLAVSWWGSEEARRNSDQVMRERRGSMLEPFAGTITVENYEVAVFRSAQPPRVPLVPAATTSWSTRPSRASAISRIVFWWATGLSGLEYWSGQ